MNQTFLPRERWYEVDLSPAPPCLGPEKGESRVLSESLALI